MHILDMSGSSRSFALLLVALGLPLAGCSNVDRAVATSPIPDDYHLRHPVVLTDARQTLDIFLNGVSDKLDDRQGRDVAAFAADYRAHGQGRILALLPRGRVSGQAVDSTLSSIRRALSSAGVKGEIEVGSYRALDPSLAAPVRLSFTKLQARLASRCGDWPDDLGSGSNVNTWENRSYYNLGCSTQQTLAAQVDDPRDLVRPRAEDPSDVQMRTRAIGDLRGSADARHGIDPATQWQSSSLIPIGSGGGR